MSEDRHKARSATFGTVPQDVCIFCERGKPLVKITKEHLLSRWVDDVLTPDLLGPDRSFERTTAGTDGTAVTKTWPTEVIAAVEAAVVCGSRPDGCNGGWMSELDGQVRHLLEHMMLGKPRKLAPGEQLTIAAWAAMKSMVLEYFWGPSRSSSFRRQPGRSSSASGARRRTCRSGSPQLNPRGRPALLFRRVYQLQPKAAGGLALPRFASCSTLVLGCFVMHTYGTSVTGPATSKQPHGRNYLFINPPTSADISWPPPEALDDPALDRFAHPLQPVTGD